MLPSYHTGRDAPLAAALVLDLLARNGQTVSGLVDVVRNPIYSTGVGLLQVGQRNAYERGSDSVSSGGFNAVWERMKSWFQGNF